VTLLLREPFDYTDWQKDLYRGETVASLFGKVKAFESAGSNSNYGKLEAVK